MYMLHAFSLEMVVWMNKSMKGSIEAGSGRPSLAVRRCPDGSALQCHCTSPAVSKSLSVSATVLVY